MEKMSDDDLEFQYASECDFEVHCSAYGISGTFIRIRGTDIIGVGSTMGLITGTTQGHIHYNDSLDLIGHKYEVFVVISNDGVLRIDFTKIYPNADASRPSKATSPAMVFMGQCPDGRPDNIEPFIGIMAFDREDSS